jgi:hypothetical protein
VRSEKSERRKSNDEFFYSSISARSGVVVIAAFSPDWTMMWSDGEQKASDRRRSAREGRKSVVNGIPSISARGNRNGIM